MAVCDILDLCLEVTTDPDDDNVILIRETDAPDMVVRTPRKNWAAFVDDVKSGKLDEV